MEFFDCDRMVVGSPACQNLRASRLRETSQFPLCHVGGWNRHGPLVCVVDVFSKWSIFAAIVAILLFLLLSCAVNLIVDTLQRQLGF